MTNLERQKIVYDMLSEVYFEGAYCGMVLNQSLPQIDAEDKPIVTKLYYGVLEKNVYLKYVIAQLCKSKPKPKVALILKIALYQLYFTSQPAHAVISSGVELCKEIGKQQVSGFVNAVLKNYKKVVLPDKRDKIKYLSVFGGVPEWLAKKLIKQYGFDFAYQMLTVDLSDKTHIRHNPSVTTADEVFAQIPDSQKTEFGFYVTAGQMAKLGSAQYTAQSVSSIKAVHKYVCGLSGGKVLDTCAAPGGKSVLMAQLGDFDVTACDIHEHRVELIKKYATRMGCRVNAVLNDATVFNPDWENDFDLVVCDVPCSGIGVIHSKPDILLNREEKDIPELVAVQTKILETSARYVKNGGRLCYSTCTVLYEENQRVVERFLKEHDDFELVSGEYDDGMVSIYPNVDGCDGFFVAVLRRK